MCVLNLILVWTGVGFYSGLAVATSDLCVDPTKYAIGSTMPTPDGILHWIFHIKILTIQCMSSVVGP